MSLLKWIAITLASTALAHTVGSGAEPDDLGARDWCGTVAKPDWLLADSVRVAEHAEKRQTARQSSITVSTYFHVVANSTRIQDGYLSDEMLTDQLQVLNEDFASSYISFQLLDVSRTVNRTWATSIDTRDHLEMQKALRRGTYSALNIYFRTYVGDPDDGQALLGLCTLPDTFPTGSNNFYRDGCMVLHSTVPGGSRPGKTTTHEVGHWFGLLHTFEGGCTGVGDGVADTPAEASPSRSCNLTRDTCPNQSGYDPVENFMDYSPSPCRKEFTPGQSARMWGWWSFFRG
ncbi:metalloprotease 1 precursor [Lasiosphaeris hirsuta]|uniref:Metalloprotease 1 n=1 Tax=Lasiosphaeris hirsuta TaxID=260670 RepID=A0AA39ZVU4_9PEZI|nr:metalloprotease 1 precursor [Lasiosphaeris hirsuta]